MKRKRSCGWFKEPLVVMVAINCLLAPFMVSAVNPDFRDEKHLIGPRQFETEGMQEVRGRTPDKMKEDVDFSQPKDSIKRSSDFTTNSLGTLPTNNIKESGLDVAYHHLVPTYDAAANNGRGRQPKNERRTWKALSKRSIQGNEGQGQLNGEEPYELDFNLFIEEEDGGDLFVESTAEKNASGENFVESTTEKNAGGAVIFQRTTEKDVIGDMFDETATEKNDGDDLIVESTTKGNGGGDVFVERTTDNDAFGNFIVDRNTEKNAGASAFVERTTEFYDGGNIFEITADTELVDIDGHEVLTETNICGPPPTVEKALMIMTNMSYGNAWCNPGHSSLTGDIKVTLICVDGQWMSYDQKGPVLPSCVPLVTPSPNDACPEFPIVEHGHVEVHNEKEATLICDVGFSTPSSGFQRSKLHCLEGNWKLSSSEVLQCISTVSTSSNVGCEDAPQIPNAVIQLENSTYGLVSCKEGFSSSSGKAEMVVTCLQQKWKFLEMEEKEEDKIKMEEETEEEKEKKEEEMGPIMECLSNDPCVAVPIPDLLNGNVIKSLSGITGRCFQGYKFSSGEYSSVYSCQEGSWKLPPSESDRCLPWCGDGCLNGGSCVYPDLCMCKASYTGARCEGLIELESYRGVDYNPLEDANKFNESLMSLLMNDGMLANTENKPDDGVTSTQAPFLPQELPGKLNAKLAEDLLSSEFLEEDPGTTETTKEISPTELYPHFPRARQLGDLFPTPTHEPGLSMLGEAVEPDYSPIYESFGIEEPIIIGTVMNEHTIPLHKNSFGYQTSGSTGSGNSVHYEITNHGSMTHPQSGYSVSISTGGNKISFPTGFYNGTIIETLPTNKEIPCRGPYPTVFYGAIYSVDEVPYAECNEGKTFPSGLKRVKLSCINGKWVLPNEYTGGGYLCINEISCKEPCQNGGHCLPDGSCSCPRGFSGRHCEVGLCGDLPIVLYNAYLNKSSLTTHIAACRDGFAFLGGEKVLRFDCVDGIWVIPRWYQHRREAICTAVCSPPCINGGKCIEPGICRCREKYTGPTCNVLKCFKAPPYVKNADVEYNPIVSLARCLKGYTFSGGNTTLNIKCVNGDWVPDFCEDERNPQLECFPVCEQECFNGGTCVAPNRCACPVPYDGPLCTSIRDNHCNISPPMVKHAYMNYSITLGIADCYTGYALNTRETSVKFVCSYGQWEFHESSIMKPECHPVCSGGCQNGGVCVDANTCTCVKPYSGVLCQDMASDVCLTLPAAIPNSVMHMSPGGLLVVCQAGYALPSGNTQTELWCQNNRWVPSMYNNYGYPMLIDDPANPLACFPTCDPPCQNYGECVDINVCQCKNPYTGSHCQDLLSHYCWNEPPAFENAFIMYDSSKATVTCKEGYISRNPSIELSLRCRKGEWVLSTEFEKPACIPSCVPPCDNGGVCSAPNKCTCRPGFDGNLCEEESCPSVPRAILNSQVYTDTDDEASIECYEGYIMNTGTHKMLMTCAGGVWLTVESRPRTVDSLECQPFCTELCRNGGTCIAPNLCKCIETYAGQYCQYDRCHDLPITDKNAIIKLSDDLTKASVTCEDNYSISMAYSTLEYSCSGGRWVAPQNIHMRMKMSCIPMCPRGCVNGGDCVAPNTCKCPQGFTGSSCERRYTITVDGKHCVFPFLYQDKWYSGCTNVGSSRPWCATEVTVHGFVSSYAICVADLGWTRVVVTIKGNLCSFPFIFEGKRHHHCITTKLRSQPWCAIKVGADGNIIKWEVCDLNFGEEIVKITILGQRCHLPFYHNGRKYYDCVYDDVENGVLPWCPTKVSPEGHPITTAVCMLDWGPNEVVRTKNNRVCHFPFIYMNQTVDSCISGTSNKIGFWCATKVDRFGIMIEWDICILEDNWQNVNILNNTRITPLPQPGRIINITSVYGRPCIFPFIYEGMKYTGCIIGDNGRPFCATAVDAKGIMVAKDPCPNNWDIGSIVIREVPIYPEIKGSGTVKTVTGRICIFPFIYKGFRYHACIMDDSSTQPFCATETNYAGEAVSTGYCPWNWYEIYINFDQRGGGSKSILTETGNTCIIPFIYNGRQYYGCIISGSGRPMCATEVDKFGRTVATEYCPPDWDKNRKQDLVLLPPGGGKDGGGEGFIHIIITVTGKKCIFPFVLNGQTYYECIMLGSDKPFCATEVDSYGRATMTDFCRSGSGDSNGKYKEIGPGGDSNGKYKEIGPGGGGSISEGGSPCVFPFHFDGKDHYSCEHGNSPRPWCATSVDDERRHINWDYCHHHHHEHGPPTKGELWGAGPYSPNPNDPSGDLDVEFIVPGHGGSSHGGGMVVYTVAGHKCIFPFYWGGRQYYTCMYLNTGTSWCPTSLDAKGQIKTFDRCLSSEEGNNGFQGNLEMTRQFPGNNGFQGNLEMTRQFPGHCREIKTKSEQMCILPFKYQGRWYSECSKLNPHEPPMCATQVNANRELITKDTCFPGWYKQRVPSRLTLYKPQNEWMGDNQVADDGLDYTQLPIHEKRIKTERGYYCKLPFRYRGKDYYDCTDKDHERPWCIIEHSLRKWDNCASAFVSKSSLEKARPLNGMARPLNGMARPLNGMARPLNGIAMPITNSFNGS